MCLSTSQLSSKSSSSSPKGLISCSATCIWTKIPNQGHVRLWPIWNSAPWANPCKKRTEESYRLECRGQYPLAFCHSAYILPFWVCRFSDVQWRWTRRTSRWLMSRPVKTTWFCLHFTHSTTWHSVNQVYLSVNHRNWHPVVAPEQTTFCTKFAEFLKRSWIGHFPNYDSISISFTLMIVSSA